MDTSEIYIKMCEKATEIQGKPIAYGSYYSAEKSNLVFTVPTVGKYIIPRFQDDSSGPYDMGHYAIWLPMQDQLQEMMREGEFSVWEANALWDWIREGPVGEDWTRTYCEQFTSFEQLWLAFVMHEKYGKKWNGQDWVKD